MAIWLFLTGAMAAWAAPVVFVPLTPLLPPPAAPEAPPTKWVVDRLDVTVDPGEETALSLDLRLHPLQEGWIDLPLLGNAAAISDARVDGEPLALTPNADGSQHLVIYLDRPRRVRVQARLATPTSRLDLPVAAAVRRELRVRGPWDADLPGSVRLSGQRFDGGDPTQLALSWKPQAPPPPRPTVLRAEVATALRIDGAGIEATSVLRWRIAHGSVAELRLALPAGVDGVELSGDGLLGYQREGDVLRATLSRAVSDRVELRLRYRAPAPKESAAVLPLPWPEANEVNGWCSLLRADTSLVVPAPRVGATPASMRDLPAWGQGLAEGEAIASYALSGQAPQVDARLLRWDPVEGPPTLIDEARYEVATADHGRLLLRARFQVRNDRRQFLRLHVPRELELISASVAGRQVQAARDADGVLLIPLEKSVETLQGLVTFPVDIAFWGSDEPWTRRGRRALQTPSVDAPVAYARWELVLPPGYHARKAKGNATEVAVWTDRAGGLSYGRAYGETLDEETAAGEETGRDAAEERSQSYWNQAYQAYKENRFDDASVYNARALEANPDNRAAEDLQGNLDVLLDLKPQGKQADDEAASRRVRELARAKTATTRITQEKLKAEAEEALRAGDTVEAEKALEALVKVSGVLAVVEQAEQVDKKAELQKYSARLAGLRQKPNKDKEQVERRASWSSVGSGGSGGSKTPISSQALRDAAREKRHESVEFLKQIIAERNPQGEQRAEMMLRLADLYAQEGLELCLAETARGSSDFTESQAWLDKAIRLYRQLLDSYPTYARADQARASLDDVLAQYNQHLPATPEPEEDLEEIPLKPGFATVIMEDPEFARQLREALVVDPDISDLLTAEDTLGWTGEEGLRTEVVYESFGMLGSGSGGSGSGYGQGAGSLGSAQVSATSVTVPIPRAGQILRFEARLLSENEPLSIDLSYRPARDRRAP